MKRFLLLILVFIGFISCNQTEKIFLRSYIMYYYDFESIELRQSLNNVIVVSEYPHYGSKNLLGGYDSKGSEKSVYDALCEKHNDMTYNRDFVIVDGGGGKSTRALSVDIVSIDIVSDADYNDEHLAGESLGDIVRYYTFSYKPYIESGYKLYMNDSNHGELSIINGLLSEITPTNKLYLLEAQYNYILELKFEIRPTLSKTHTFTVTMTADDGRVFSDSIEMTFE